jgi:hypothetical protein
MNRHAPRSNAEADDAWEDQLLRVDSSGSSNTTALDQPIGAYEKRYHWTIPYVDPTGRALVTRIRSDSGGPIDAAWVEPRYTPLPTWNRWAGPSGDYNPVAMTPLSNGAVLMGGHDNYELDGVKYAISNITLFKLNPPPA